MFTTPHLSCVNCHISHVTFHVSNFIVPCEVYKKKLPSWLVEGLLSMGPIPSSFHKYCIHSTMQRPFNEGLRSLQHCWLWLMMALFISCQPHIYKFYNGIYYPEIIMLFDNKFLLNICCLKVSQKLHELFSMGPNIEF